MSIVAKIKFKDYVSSVKQALDAIGAAGQLPSDRTIIIKPNLTNSDGPPVTTDVRAVEAVYLYCREHTKAEIIIAEGCGSGTTDKVYKATGYTELASEYGIQLVDFNTSDTVEVQDPNGVQLTSFRLPVIARDAYIISVPILKDHCFTVTTIAMKNMFGLAPEPYYGGSWNKSALHSPSTHISVVDICRYKKPDLSVVDARVALAGMHLSGTPKKLNTILAGFDPVALDAVGSEMMGHDPKQIEYLVKSNGLHGSMDDIRIVK